MCVQMPPKMKHFGIHFCTHTPDCGNLTEVKQDWFSVCRDTKEIPPANAPEPLGKPVQLTHCVDANLLHDLTT